MLKIIARSVTILLHPLLIPTFGFLVLLNAGFYFSMVPPEVKKYILIVVFFATAVLPLVSVVVMSFNPKFDLTLEKVTDRVVIQLIAAVFYYIGYFLMGRLNIFPVFKVFLISGALLIVILSIISLRWKISPHLAGWGALLGALLALSFRLGINPEWWIAAVILAAGFSGTSVMLLGKHTFLQMSAGFGLGFTVLYLIVSFI